MRECLGWITTCANDSACPQNWLEVSVTELPCSVSCHVCRAPVDLVLSSDDLLAKARQGLVAAHPSVPCVAMPAVARGGSPNDPQRSRLDVAPPRAQTPPPPPKSKGWSVRLSNGEVVSIEKDSVVIGRSRTCDVVIPSAKVSRQHATVSRLGGELFVEDLGSANGVWLNGEKISRVKVTHGDVFTISDELLTFEQR